MRGEGGKIEIKVRISLDVTAKVTAGLHTPMDDMRDITASTKKYSQIEREAGCTSPPDPSRIGEETPRTLIFLSYIKKTTQRQNLHPWCKLEIPTLGFWRRKKTGLLRLQKN